MTLAIRPMTRDDVARATDTILRGNWGDRRTWFEFATTQPECRPFVADLDGELVGTGVGTINGRVGWIGTIFVAPEQRGRGVGRALTQAVIDALEVAGCRSLLLVATDEGRRLYERMGFDVETHYRILELAGSAAGPAVHAEAADEAFLVRPFGAADLTTMVDLDRAATGEDRRHLIARFSTPSSSLVATNPAGAIRGWMTRAPWGGGATIAVDADAALAILGARRSAKGPEGRVRLAVVDENGEGLNRLDRLRARTVRIVPRMIRGEPVAWRPDWIWGQFNMALG